MYQALYRKYRPQTFEDVIGQEHITESLKNQVESGRLSHAYIFIGTRGTGKTTCARILAKAVNCEHPVNGNPCLCCESCLAMENGELMDVTELDAASNNGVDDVRALRETVGYAPMEGRYKIFIVDEAHMLSKAAFNALLKTLEEPPPRVAKSEASSRQSGRAFWLQSVSSMNTRPAGTAAFVETTFTVTGDQRSAASVPTLFM